MTGLNIVNKGVCGQGSLGGYNMNKGCPIPFKDVKEIWRTPSDFEFDLSVDWDAEYIKSLQLAGSLSIIKNIVDFPEGGTDNLIESLADGTELDAGDAMYKFTPVWAQDFWLNVQLGKLEGQNNNRFIFVDSAGNMAMTKGSTDSKARGFITSRTKREKVSLQAPGTGAKQSLAFQLSNAYELEDNIIVMANELLEFDPRLIESIAQSYVSFAVQPATTDTTISVNAILDRGRKGVITGLTTSGDFKVYVNDVAEADSVATMTGDNYIITLGDALVSNDVVSVSINGVKEVIGDALYVSNTAETTV